LFKNKEEQIKAIYQKHAKGEVNIPTELEVIMLEEAIEKIDKQYDHLEGKNQL
jgi:hypothetical protein